MPWSLFGRIGAGLAGALKGAAGVFGIGKALNQRKGASGEAQAYHFLRKSGYKVVARNYRKRFGEIDLVAWDRDVLAFVEVKYRTGGMRGRPEEAVTPFKQKQICRVAREYRARHRLHDINYRFDIVAIQEGGGQGGPRLIKDAFKDHRW